jgi:ATP-dependent exoDNAse (exonuclease V) beta subunit
VPNLLLYKASAGSGKTFTLVKEYLKIALQSPANYRRTLAVTFTNKAANEMKQRIVKALNELADVQCQNGSIIDTLLPALMAETGFSESEIRLKAAKILTSILHNYSDFAISTIDAFVFGIIRTFSRDLKLPFQFEVELDDNTIARMAIEMMLNEIGNDALITESVVDFARYKINTDENWNIERDLKNYARMLFKEEAYFYLKNNEGADSESFKKMNRTIVGFIHTFENELVASSAKVLSLLDKQGITNDLLVGKSKGIFNYFTKLSKKDIFGAYDLKSRTKLREDGIWANSKSSEALISPIQFELNRLFESQNNLFDSQLQKYAFYKLLAKNLHVFALTAQLGRIISEIKDENNIVHISEFNKRIAEVVSGSSVPYIYERIGEKYNNYLVDEFQDTSVLQWQNFLPLISNSLANNRMNLIVGDGKQAIYRFRSGEVEQFMNLPTIYNKPESPEFIDIENQLVSEVSYNNLNMNFRSAKEIVAFNNDFFEFLEGKLGDFSKIYSGLRQEVKNLSQPGYLEFRFSEAKNAEAISNDYLAWILEIVQNQRADGYNWSDIAILVRANAKGDRIARFLTENGIPIVSSDSLLLASNMKVRLLITMFRYLTDNENIILQTEIVFYWQRLHPDLIKDDEFQNGHFFTSGERTKVNAESLEKFLGIPAGSLDVDEILYLGVYDLAEYFIRLLGFDKPTDPYMVFLLDVIHTFQAKECVDLNDFLEYWDEFKKTASLKIPTDLDAVKIMSIHKAKGLEFPVVIFPFADNSSVRLTKKETWVDLTNENFDNIGSGIIPVNKDLKETHLAHLYDQEEAKSKLDMMNTLYVVMTRPTNRIYVLSKKADVNKSSFTFQSFFTDFLSTRKDFQNESVIYSIGNVSLAKNKKIVAVNVAEPPVFDFVTEDWRSKLIISPDPTSQWRDAKTELSIEWGNLVHHILSEIQYEDGVEAIFENYLREGTINSVDLERLKSYYNQIVMHDELKDCFSSKAKIRNEAEIMTTDGQVYRPDRFVNFGDRAIILDYKTGSAHSSYLQQMKQYTSVVSQLEKMNVDAYLVYLNETISVVKC